jgi:acyl carrier protein
MPTVRDGIEYRIKNLFHDVLGMNTEKTEADHHLINDMGLDDLDKIELDSALEEEFSITITDMDFENLETFGDVVDMVTRKAGN